MGEPSAYELRRATEADATAIADLVNAAYGHYVARIGGHPGPMLADYDAVVREQDVTVATASGALAAVLVLDTTAEGFLVDNVAVHPDHQGRGLGRRLLALAEDRARLAGFASLYLYTHVKMTENLALYGRLGYVEYDRRTDDGFTRVFLRKQL